MAEYEWDYGGDTPYDEWSWDRGDGNDSWRDFLSWGGDETQQPWYQSADLDTGNDVGGTNWLSSILGAIGPLAKQFGGLGATTIGSLLNAGRGRNAARTAGVQEADALNRGLDLQTAQWLQQQQNLAPYLQAGRGGLEQLQQLAGRDQLAVPEGMDTIDPRAYGMPNATPQWVPQGYQGPQVPNAGDYRWNPQQGPQAANYRYTPGDIPSAADYRYTPGAVPTLSGKELLANDPGVQFRQDQARKALEASAAARGGLMSGPTLAALQSQGQEQASQEYGNAWNRASQQAQMREGWAQTASQMGYQQAESEARLREQVNQIASQQGWSQAQAEAVFREQMAQQSSQQGFNQALAGQGQQYTQGFANQQWEQQQRQLASDQLYNRNLEQYKLVYGQDVARNEQDSTRQQNLYRQRLAQSLLPWEQQSTLANLGGQAVGMYGQQGQGSANAISKLLEQLGQARGQSTLGQVLPGETATNTVTNSLASVLSKLNS